MNREEITLLNSTCFMSSEHRAKIALNYKMGMYNIAEITSEDVSYDMIGSVAIIELKGYMYDSKTERVAKALRLANEDSNVTNIILKVNSPGGAVSSVEHICNFLTMEGRKQVDAVCADCCSGGYYISMYADNIWASSKNSRFGSIGVMTTMVDDTKYWENLGIKIEDIYADQSSTKNEDFREFQKGNTKPIKENNLNILAANFLNEVKENRPDIEDEKVFSGSVFYAEDAIAKRLINGIKSVEVLAKELSNTNTNTNNFKSMTKEEFKAQNPSAYNEIVEEGVKAEQTRVRSWLAHHDADSVKVIKGIKSNEELGADVREELIVAAISKNRTSPSDNADSLDTTESATETQEDKTVAETVAEIKNQLNIS